MIDLKSLAVGDKVTLTQIVEVTSTIDRCGDVPVRVISGAYTSDWLFNSSRADYQVECIVKAPRPIQVGDRVVTPGGTPCSVVALADGWALVRPDDPDYDMLAREIASLTLA